MSAITELLEHRTKLIAMKASILVDKRGGKALPEKSVIER